MTKRKKLALLLATAAALTVIPAWLGSSAPAESPYLSALSDVVATPALAAPCGNRACDVTQFRTCFNNAGTHCKLNVRTAAGCATVGC